MLSHRERRRFTPEEYLQLEETSTCRNEYIGGEIFSMTGGSLDHNRLVGNLFAALKQALRGGPCEVFSSDVRLLVERFTLFTYPDLVVVCGPPRLMADRPDTLTDARVIVEVLSPSTESYDRSEKFRMYRALPSLEEYVLVAQDAVRVERHHRQASGDWLWTELTQREDRLELLSLALAVGVNEIYESVLT
ncbi:Uma2 family endonuclease [bacterium CPR1]|nr:Uma2 family endonuclease [bacterium CPR1]